MNIGVLRYKWLKTLSVFCVSMFLVACDSYQDYRGDDFNPPVTLNTGPLPWLVHVGDVNGDQKADILTANALQSGNMGISLFLNQTESMAEAPAIDSKLNVTAGPLTSAVTLADFNNDGVVDIAAANMGNMARGVSVSINEMAIGDEEPVFSKPHFFRGGPITHLVVAGDLNADGKVDLVTGNSGTLANNAVSVLLNTTTAGSIEPSFTSATHFKGGGIAEGLALGDFNSDGKLDIVEGNTLSSTVTILINDTQDGELVPEFTGPTVFNVNFATGIAVGDFNQDNKPDLVVASTLGGTYVLLNATEAGASQPEFSPPFHYSTGGDVTENVVIADFNNDGLMDFAASNDNVFTLTNNKNGVAVFYNRTPTNDLHPVFDGPFTYPPSPGANSLAAGDINGDGYADLAIGVVNPFGIEGLSILINKGNE